METNSFGNVWKLAFGPQPAILKSVSISPGAVAGGTSLTGTVTLIAGAPAGGTVVSLSSSFPHVKVPATVQIPAGESTATFPVTTSPVASQQVVILTGKDGTSTKSATLKVNTPSLASLAILPISFVGASSTVVTGTVSLNAEPASGGATITLSSSDSSVASVPATVLVHSGHSSITFSVKHFKVTSPQTVTIQATYGTVTKSFNLVVKP